MKTTLRFKSLFPVSYFSPTAPPLARLGRGCAAALQYVLLWGLLLGLPLVTRANVSSTISVSPTTANPGATVVYTLVIRDTNNNNDPNVGTTLTLSGAARPTSSAALSSATGFVYNTTSGVVTFTTSQVDVPRNGSKTITLSVVLPSPLAAGAQLSATAATTGPASTATVPAGSTSTVTISNVAPVANADNATAGSAVLVLDVLGNDTDANGNASINSASMALGAATGTASGTFALGTGANAGKIVFTPTSTSGTATVAYTVRDNAGAVSNAATITVTVVAAPSITDFSPNSGAIGATVIIRGTNFSGATGVSFNGTAASYTVTNATQIRAIVPTGAKTGFIQVTTPGGTATSAEQFTLPPVIESVSPAPNSLSAARTAPVVITFDQPITAASAAQIRIFSSARGGRIAASVEVSGNTITLTPTLYFKSGEVISVTIPNSVSNGKGQGAAAMAYQFTVGTQGGTGVFSSIADQVTGMNPSNQVLADVDGDSKLDLVVVNYGNGTGNSVSVNRYTGGSGTPSLAARQDFTLGSGQTGSYNIAAGDFDGDGKLDLVTANEGSANVSVLHNTTTGPGAITASSFAASQPFAVGARPAGIAVGDIDGDGRLDILTANIGSNTVSFLQNTTVGATISFAAAQNITVGTAPYGVTVADVNTDGKLDIISANSGNNTVSVLLNATAGAAVSFTRQNFSVGSTPVVVVAGDLNNDGKIDLATVNNGSNNVSVVRNTTSGATLSFAAAQNFAVGGQPAGLAIGDINSDGKLDLIAANYGSGTTTGNGTTLSYIRNTSTTSTAITMAGQSIVAVGAGPNSVALGDLDGDGDLDVVTANQGGDNTTASIRINDTSAPPLPLPVELITFQAQLIAGNNVVLAWRTALEKNNDHFAVERSFDGLAFEVMGQVPGHGTSTTYHDYTFTDASVSAYTGTVHYRLRQVDADGQVHVTPIRSLRVAAIVAGGDFHLFPNPATDQALLDLNALPAGTYQVRILDMMGREVHRAQVQGGGLPVVDLRAVKSGTYQLLIQGNQVNLSHKLVKQN